MELNISIKEEHGEFLNEVRNEFSFDGKEKTIKILVKEILDKFDYENVFGEIRCVGGCFSNDQFVKVKLDENLISEMRDIFKKYEFEDYDSEEEELSKVVRCIINFADQECELSKVLIS